MRGSSLLRILVHVSRFGLAALFLFAAGAKLFTLSDFAANLSNLVEARWVWPVAIAVVASELLAAALLLLPRTVRLGAAFSALLLLGFAAYALYYVYVLHGEPLECGCFGRLIASQLGVTTALRNLALLIPCALVLFVRPRSRANADVEVEQPSSLSSASG
ncbi:MAG TPA: MauE/DoxX family redox-associated membrane protein [Pyrinomonadaceae bacterium]|nr:MauE/DoxX family redox-associated membrane protein [Pyrinomonadaceae bacterium]